MVLTKRLTWISWIKRIFAIALLAGLAQPGAARAQSPGVDLDPAHQIVERALEDAREGDLAAAQTSFDQYEAAWSKIEDAVRAQSPDTYAELELNASRVMLALDGKDAKAAEAALSALELSQEKFLQLAGQPVTNETQGIAYTPAMLIAELTEARAFQSAGQYDDAADEMGHFQKIWLNVEGEIKTRGADAYRQTENDMALALDLLQKKSPDSAAVLERMSARLEPFAAPQAKYGAFDAAIIILREGLEAMLVIVALLAFLRKSGNANKVGWVWGGVAAGLLLSVLVGIGIQVAFSAIITPANRELIEGITGLVAAAMLIYVSYWMHSKSSAVAWAHYIKQRSTAALAAGSLTGIAALAFLSIFREGAETALFFVGMAASISMADLLTGLVAGAVALLVLGIVLMRIGARLPVSMFFGVASVLVFYLCFKFLGTGLHALQVANILPATAAPFLPESAALGMYPTWQTFLAQMVLLAAALIVAAVSQIRFAALKKKAAVA